MQKLSKPLESCLADAALFTNLRTFVDMGYTNIDPRVSIFHALERKGLIKRIVSDDEIKRAMSEPPGGRAFQRTLLLNTFAEKIVHTDWHQVSLREQGKLIIIKLKNPLGYNTEAVKSLVAKDMSLEKLRDIWISTIEKSSEDD